MLHNSDVDQSKRISRGVLTEAHAKFIHKKMKDRANDSNINQLPDQVTTSGET